MMCYFYVVLTKLFFCGSIYGNKRGLLYEKGGNL